MMGGREKFRYGDAGESVTRLLRSIIALATWKVGRDPIHENHGENDPTLIV